MKKLLPYYSLPGSLVLRLRNQIMANKEGISLQEINISFPRETEA
jgi:hypothetical protein